MDLTQGKALISSKVFWGALFAVIAIVANAFGFQSFGTWIGSPKTVDLVMTILDVLGGFGGIFAMYGRTVATVPITGIVKVK